MDEVERQRRILAGAQKLVLWAEVNDIADTAWAEADAAAQRDRVYPLAAAQDVYLVGNGHGILAGGLGPFHADPAPFTLQTVPRYTYVWRYIEPPPPMPVYLLDWDAPIPPTGPTIKTHDVQLRHWGLSDGRRLVVSWWVAWAPELATYLIWKDGD